MEKHSGFIGLSIELYVEKSEEKEITDPEEAEDELKDEEEVDKEKENEEKKKETKKVKEVSHEWEQFNQNKPLCMQKSEDVTNEEYASFYKWLSNDREDQLSVSGSFFVRVVWVFIMDVCDELIPEWILSWPSWIPRIFLWTSLGRLCSRKKSCVWSRRTLWKSASKCLQKCREERWLQEFLRTKGKLFEAWDPWGLHTTEPRLLDCRDSTPPSLVMNRSAWRNTSTVWMKGRTTFITSLARASPSCPLFTVLWKFAQEWTWSAFTWWTPWMSMLSNSSRSSTERNWNPQQRRDCVWKTKMRRKSFRSWKRSSNHWRSWWMRCSSIMLKRWLWVTESSIPFVSNDVRVQLVCQHGAHHESTGIAPTTRWLLSWCPSRPWRSIQRTPSWRSWGRRRRQTSLTRRWKTWSSSFSIRLSWPRASTWTSQRSLRDTFVGWSNSDWASMMTMKVWVMTTTFLRWSRWREPQMKRRRWRRSTKATPDEIETNSILHILGLLVHAGTRVWKKPQVHCRSVHARCLSCCERTCKTWAQTGMFGRRLLLRRSQREGG